MVLNITIIPPSALLHYSLKWVIFPFNHVVHLLQVITVLLYNQKIWRYRGGGGIVSGNRKELRPFLLAKAKLTNTETVVTGPVSVHL